MVQVSKLTFSEEEFEALRNRRFFELKKSVTASIMNEFSFLEESIRSEAGKKENADLSLPPTSGKIFRGENYKGFPYIVLDFPRAFSSRDVFAFRSMFWWGTGFSFTLHLQGESLERHREALLKNGESLRGAGFLFCINSTPWEYHFGDDNYVSLDDFTGEELDERLRKATFIKLCRKLESEQYPEIISYGTESFVLLMQQLRNR